MVWYQIGNKPLAEPMMTQFNEAYMKIAQHLSYIDLSVTISLRAFHWEKTKPTND